MTTRDEFAKSVVASGLLSADDLQTFWQRIPAPQRPKDGETLGAILVQQSRLTEYQKQELLAGRGKNLILGNYVILDKLGQGGMGMVLKAEHKRMRRIVALKVLAPNVTKSPEALARFQREVMAAAKLRHPNIVAADDADEANGTHFLVMEYVEGRDLAATVRAHGTLPPAEAVRCVLQAARGLEYAHQKGVVHRDIKPHNLILDATGTVKILDMGLARLESAGGDQDQLTGTGQIMGTVDYMAPEQAMDTKHADARADIYALGATLWFLVVGRAMYDGDTMLKKLLAHQQSPIPTFAAASVAVAPLVQEVFQRMVAKSLGDRYPSMREAIVDLERCLIDHSHAPTAMVSSSAMGRLAEQVPAVSWPGVPTSQGIATGVAAPVESPPILFAANASAPPVEATMALSRTDADTNPQPLSFVTPATSIRTRRPPARPLPSRKTMVLVGGGVAALVVSLVTTAIMLSRSPTPAPISKTAATSKRSSSAASKPKGPPPPLAIAPFDAAAAKKHQQAWADYLGMSIEKEIKLPGNVPLVMVLIPPGEFMRSDNVKDYRVRITKPFYMGKYEVTRAQW